MNTSEANPSDLALRNIEGLLPDLAEFYKDVHSHPELSMQETRTAKLAADRLRAAGYEVTTGVGKTGVVGLLRNGDGPTVMLRADMDALPVEEATGLPYASKATATDHDGNTVPVSHMCGHDMHVTWLVGATKLLAEAKTTWRGTIMAVFQPGEETAEGAQAMIDDGSVQALPEAGRGPRPACHGRAIGHGRRTCRCDHFGGGQSANSPVRSRRARLDAAGEH